MRLHGTYPIPPRAERLHIEAWTSAASAVRGQIPLRGARRLTDALNNWNGPVIALDQVDVPRKGLTSVAVLSRDEVLWVRPLNLETDPGDSTARVQKIPRRVVLHLGPFEIEATAHTFAQVRWVDFLEALGAQFFPLTDARVSWPGGVIECPFVAINAARLAALIGLEDR